MAVLVYSLGAAESGAFLGVAVAGGGLRIAVREPALVGPSRQAGITLSREDVRALTRELVGLMARGDRALGIPAAEAAP